MRLSDFDFELPPELIAQAPAARRDESRLLVVPPGDAAFTHTSFAELAGLLPPGALLVVNDARVIPARLFADKPTGGRVEILLVEPVAAEASAPAAGAAGQGSSAAGAGVEVWCCRARSHRPLRPGTELTLRRPRGRPEPGSAPPRVRYLGRDGADSRFAFVTGAPGGLLAALDEWGELPLPPYIERTAGPTDDDRERYQTVFARAPGAVAAPTAGLHFTQANLQALAARGIEMVPVTLHVGPGTFAPVREEELDRHVMHLERYAVPPATAAAHAAARAAGRPVVAVGTTVVRTLESAWDEAKGALGPGPGATRLFITPGHQFHTIDLVITNFHLPRSTLLMLVAAFAGRERMLAAYAEAVARRYRFFSYGDAMLLHPAHGAVVPGAGSRHDP